MTLIIDAGVAAKWFLPEPGRGQALRLLADTDRLAAPEILFTDIFSLIWRKVELGEMNAEQAENVPPALVKFLSDMIPAGDLGETAGRMMRQELLPSGYSPSVCFYLAAAVRLQGMLVTADRALARHLRQGLYRDQVADLYTIESIDEIIS